jgi:hypothetical protein
VFSKLEVQQQKYLCQSLFRERILLLFNLTYSTNSFTVAFDFIYHSALAVSIKMGASSEVVN